MLFSFHLFAVSKQEVFLVVLEGFLEVFEDIEEEAVVDESDPGG